MNEHEIARIAAAAHELRPDWPTASVATLIRKNLASKPRRDVAVALAWVACEPNTSSPARVLEAGPWWRAAGIEGSNAPREKVERHNRCSTCSEPRDRCRALWHDDHAFEPDVRKSTETDVPRTVAALKAELQPMRTPAKAKTVEDLPPEKRDPRVAAARAGLAPPEAATNDAEEATSDA